MSTERARALLDEPLSRGALKRAAAEIDADPDLRRALMAEAAARGVTLPPDCETWPAKRLLRRARDREGESRVRRNPVAIDEAFECVHCGRSVPAHGRSARDHCPYCLHGLHVDAEVPGDRASDCGGLLVPMQAEQKAGSWRIIYRCQRCGKARTNQALLDGDPADDWAEVVRLASARPPL